MTDFQKVPKPLVGYHCAVWAKFHKIKIQTGRYNILATIRSKSKANRDLCQVNIRNFSKVVQAQSWQPLLELFVLILMDREKTRTKSSRKPCIFKDEYLPCEASAFFQQVVLDMESD